MQLLSIFRGSGNRELAIEIARILDFRLSPSQVEEFPDGELSVCLDEPVRNHSVFVVQSTSPPVTRNIFELLLFADACRRAAAERITAVVPYFGYARADKRHGRREPITASMVAELMKAVEIHHLVTVDLHAAQIEGFFHMPVDNLTAVPTLCDELKGRLPPETVVVSPDSGRVKMAIEYAKRLGLSVAVVYKERTSGIETRVTHIAGDVQDRPCLIIDDMISTGETIDRAMAALIKAGARPEFYVAATHGLLLEGARAKLSRPSLREVLVTDTIASTEPNWPEFRVVSVAPLLAAAIHRLSTHQSIGDLFT